MKIRLPATAFFFLCFSWTITLGSSADESTISVVVSENGLNFAKDLLVKEALESLDSLRVPEIKKYVQIPFIGIFSIRLSNITISGINVSSSYITTGESGITIIASGATANLTMDWDYSYSTWLLPTGAIADQGRAFVGVDGMEVGLTMSMDNIEGTPVLSVVECGCYFKSISITLDGGASWFYQGLINAFEEQIQAAAEKAIVKRIEEGVLKLDSLLHSLPKIIRVDNVVSLNVTVVNDPLLGKSFIGFEINGLFIEASNVSAHKYLHKNFQSSPLCEGKSTMIGISVHEDAFNSGSVLYFNANCMHWVVDKVPDQSLLNTAGWKYIIPQLYKKYPNDDMELNISFSSPPFIKINREKIDATIYADMIIVVLDALDVIPVACMSIDITTSASLEISGNNLVGNVALNDFSLKLKWSKIGNFHMSLIQATMRVFLKDVFLPYVNSRIRKGFPLPMVQGFTIENASINSDDSKILICSDVSYSGSHGTKVPLIMHSSRG